MKAIILAVGHELTSGQTVDTNSAWLARRLIARGIEPAEHITVPDDRPAIAHAIADAAARAELVLITGGLGPTADDLTRHGLADAMGGAGLVLDEPSLAALEDFFRRRERVLVPANRIQVMFPAGSRPIPNAAGTAPGIAAMVGATPIYIMPGVPHEMRRMFDEQVAPLLPAGGQVIVERVLHTFGTGESDVGARIVDLMQRRRNPTVGTTVAAGLISIRISAKAATAEAAAAMAEADLAELRARLGEWVIGEGEATMASAVGELLRRAGQTVATAESCTGGMIGTMITDVPGASDYYVGGIVSYANRVKRDELGVGEELLRQHGAVSEPVARAMAAGCRARLKTDWAIAVTGIAGPTGGSEAKPVGLVWIALAGPAGISAWRHIFPGDRPTIRHRAATAALNHLRLAMMP